MNLKLETEFSKADVLKEVDALKKQIDDLRPLPEDVEGKIMQKLRLDWNYHSNAIEGNKLNYGETVAFLMEGITAKGKPLKDHLDIRGHNEAINFLLSIVKDTRPLSEADIRSLHKMILVEPYDVKAQTTDGLPTTKRIALGEYKTLPNHVKTSTGEIHYYSTPEETPAKMQQLMEWYSQAINDKNIHPVVLAALFHHKFVEIHPFDDGNGRLSRILMNLIIMLNGYPPVIIKNDDRQNYYALLSRADNDDEWPFVEYITQQLMHSLRLYFKAVKGEDINEDEDIDKEIALFKIEVKSKIANAKTVDAKGIFDLCNEQILPFIQDLFRKISEYWELFYRKSNVIKIDYIDLVHGKEHNFSIDLDKLDSVQSFSFFSNYEYKITSIFFKIELIRFKSENNNFDVHNVLMIGFRANDYQFTDDYQDLYLSKSYNEKLTQQDKRKIQITILKGLQNSIKRKLNEKSPESN